MTKDKISRRKFVTATTSTALSAMIVPRHILGGVGYQAPSDKVNFAVIGCGGQGASDSMELVTAGENLVALADVDFGYVDRATSARAKNRDGSPNPAGVKLYEAYQKAKRHTDYRKMLETQKDIDGVIIATPDHHHAIAAKTAMQLGKHVYVEKPLTWSVQEARYLRDLAVKNPKLVTQMGNQGHSSEEARLINEWVQAGLIGKVKEVQIWTNRPVNYWPQGVPRPAAPASAGGGGGFGNDWTQNKLNRTLAGGMAGNYPAPETLNWDLYCGPGPMIEYHPIYHPFNWRGWVDWGTGAIGDMAAHLLDAPYWALGLTQPSTVEATFTNFGLDANRKIASYPLASKVIYHFPARGNQPSVKVTWVDGGLMGDRPEILPDNIPLQSGGGTIFIGEKGILTHETYGKNPQLYPQTLMEKAKKLPKKYERIIADDKGNALHRVNWALAIKGKAKPSSSFDHATQLTETMLLGVVAMKAGQGKLIRYDAVKGEITNVPEANQYLKREYREGWSL